MPVLFGRVASRERNLALLQSGKLALKPVRQYRTAPNRAVGDPEEGYFYRYSKENSSLRVRAWVAGNWFPVEVQSIRLDGSAGYHGAFCMTGVPVPGDGTLPWGVLAHAIRDQQLLEFGGSFLLFRDSAEFENRIRRAAFLQGYLLDVRPVSYVPTSHCGAMGPFRKVNLYGYQNEWRFLTTTPLREPRLELDLGPLWDLALPLLNLEEVQHEYQKNPLPIDPEYLEAWLGRVDGCPTEVRAGPRETYLRPNGARKIARVPGK